jgi:multidrug efflux pump subunit AcrA (membrane-fusion protein)
MKTSTLLIARIVAIILILIMGYGGMVILSKLAKAPERTPPEEIVVRAQGLRISAESVQTHLTGYGTAKALSEVEISPEVGGRLVEIHPALKTGNVINQGELLFRIDPANYRLVVNNEAAYHPLCS